LEATDFVSCRRRHLRSKICPENRFQTSSVFYRVSVPFSDEHRRRSLPPQHGFLVSLDAWQDPISPRLGIIQNGQETATPSSSKRWTRNRSRFSDSVSPCRSPTFRRASPSPRCSVSTHTCFLPILAQPAYSTRREFLDWPLSFFVLDALKLVHRPSVSVSFQLVTVESSVT
jgi:hypothetical protein